MTTFRGCQGTNRWRPAVREIPPAVRSSEKEQASLCEVATIEDADRVLLTTFFMLRFELLFRMLNRRDCPPGSSLVSHEKAADEISARTPDPQPQSSHCSLGAVALLVSVDSFASFPSSTDSPPGCHSARSPLHCRWQLLRSGVRFSDCTNVKTRNHLKVIPGFDVEHRRFELLTPTLPVLCATNCANAPNSGYLITRLPLCKALFSLSFSFRWNGSGAWPCGRGGR